MGSYEILELRRRFTPALGLKEFHEILLAGGQLPFHLVEKRLEVRKGTKAEMLEWYKNIVRCCCSYFVYIVPFSFFHTHPAPASACC